MVLAFGLAGPCLWKGTADTMKTRVSALCTLLLMIVAPLMAQQVSVNYVKTQNFSGYHTYAWGEENANQIRNSILAQVAKTDIENAMQSKGLTA